MIRNRLTSQMLDTPALSIDEERELVGRMHAAYDAAKDLEKMAAKIPRLQEASDAAKQAADELRDRLVLSHMRLACYLAWRHHDNSSWTIDELVSEAYTVMLECASRFKMKKGCRFSGYAGIRMKFRLLEVQGKLSEAWAKERKMRIAIRTAPLLPHEGVKNETILDGLVQAEEAEANAQHRKALDAFRTLPDRTQEALRLNLGLDSSGGLSRGETAKELGLSRSGAQHHVERGLRAILQSVSE